MKYVIRLNTSELMKAANEHGLDTDTKLGAAIGVSSTQIWRAKLPPDDPRHNSPGSDFIAGTLAYFKAPFERFFFLEQVIRERSKKAQ